MNIAGYEKLFMGIGSFLYVVFTLIRRHSSKKTKAVETAIEFRESKRGIDFLRLLIFYEVATFGLYVINVNINPQKMLFQLQMPLWLRWTGVFLFVIADVLFYLVHRHLGPNFYSNLKLRTGHELVTSGPYQYMRHPMYLGFYLNHAGVFLMTGNWLIGSTWFLAFTLIMIYRLGREEQMMIDKFGDAYSRYMARSGKLLPRLRKL